MSRKDSSMIQQRVPFSRATGNLKEYPDVDVDVDLYKSVVSGSSSVDRLQGTKFNLRVQSLVYLICFVYEN